MLPVSERVRAVVRAAMAIVAVASIAWSVWVFAVGGFDTSFLGLRIRSNNPQRILTITAIALAGFFLAGGTLPLARLAAAARRRATWVARRPGWIAAAIAAATATIAFTNSTRIAGGADAYGYVSQADLWRQGTLKVPQPWAADVPWPNARWTFTPLGYRPAHDTTDNARDGDWSIVPTYSPGLPMLLAAAKSIGGQCAMFAVVPILAGLAVLATCGIGRRLGDPIVGLIGAWLVATSPISLGSSLEPLTDVPVMTMWTLAFYLALGRSTGAAAAAGLSAAVAILIRPNLVPLALPIGLWFLFRRATAGSPPSTRLVHAGAFGVATLLGIAAVAAINQHLYGSATTSGYGRLEDQFALARMLPNLQRYVSWLAETHTPFALLGLAALLVPARRLWPHVPDRRVFVAIGSFVALLWGLYVAYLEFDSWGYLRFLLPSWPFVMLGVGAVAVAIARLGRAAGWVAGLGVVALGVWNAGTAIDLGVFEQRQAARHEAPLGHLVQTRTAPNSVILAFERSGSMRYYGGRVTLRYDILDGEWLDRAVDWLTARGVHVYALLDRRQAEEAKARFSTQRRAIAFDRPFLIYDPAGTALFDLSEARDPAQPAEVITTAFPDAPGCDPPALLAPLVLR